MTWLNTPIPYFSTYELECKCCGELMLDTSFAALLPALRQLHGAPLTANSVCRCPAHNANVGGHRSSLHLTQNAKHKTVGTAAADLAWRAWPPDAKLRLARLAWGLGLSVGLHNSFIHVDARTSAAGLPQHAFLYGDWDGEFSPDDVRSN